MLPDIGGHLYTCVDKINGKPIFYANPSIKKAEIGYRGAWAAFGVEFNFPVSHNWVSMSPVDFAFAKHEAGDASVTVGNIDCCSPRFWKGNPFRKDAPGVRWSRWCRLSRHGGAGWLSWGQARDSV